MVGELVSGRLVAFEGAAKNQTAVKSPAKDERESATRGLRIINRGECDVANHGE
jgi:hypothetical protein